VTPAVLSHAPVLKALHAAAFPAPWTAAEFETFLSQPGVAGWIADEAAPKGFILVRAAADEAEILTLAVDPAHRRAGIASRLLRAATAALSAGKTQRVFLEVAADNGPALALYERHGFEICGRRAHYYGVGDKRVDAVMMRRALP